MSIAKGKLLLSDYVLSLLRYCVTIWGNATKTDLNNVNKCVRRCARMLYRKSKFDSMSGELKTLGWLKVDNMYKFSICVFVYLTLINSVPDYFMDYVTI